MCCCCSLYVDYLAVDLLKTILCIHLCSCVCSTTEIHDTCIVSIVNKKTNQVLKERIKPIPFVTDVKGSASSPGTNACHITGQIIYSCMISSHSLITMNKNTQCDKILTWWRGYSWEITQLVNTLNTSDSLVIPNVKSFVGWMNGNIIFLQRGLSSHLCRENSEVKTADAAVLVVSGAVVNFRDQI